MPCSCRGVSRSPARRFVERAPRTLAARSRALVATVALAVVASLSVAERAEAFHPHLGCFRPGFGAVGWHGGWHGGWWGGGPRFGGFGWGGPAFVGGGWGWPAAGWGGCWPVATCGWGWPGWGWGGCYPAFGTVSYGTGFWGGGTRFWSGSTVFGVPFWGGCGPVWWGGAPVCGGPIVGGGCVGGVGPAAWYSGWNVGSPAGWNPPTARGWLLPMAARAPAGRRPAAAMMAAAGPVAGQRGPAAAFGARELLGANAIDESVVNAARTTNAPTRARAARLVAIGDGHLRAAVEEPKRLAKAIDAFRRAAAIAPRDPDIHLRQAIALTAAGKETAAATAFGKALAIDGRLADPPSGGAPLIGLVAVTKADVRSSRLLERIFVEQAGHAPAGLEANWIARRWGAREGALAVLAARP